jgi:4-alpha-glucanotransferase
MTWIQTIQLRPVPVARAKRDPALSSRRARSRFRLDRRGSGLLFHPTSLPGPHFSGDLGPAAYAFADFLAAAGQRWWQMLPINPPGAAPGHSPYSSYSAFAGSPWLISLDKLVDDGLLGAADVAPPAHLNGRPVADLSASIRFRLPRLRKAYEAFKIGGGLSDGAFERFCAEQRAWLENYALFSALKDATNGAAWSSWPMDLRLRIPSALASARRRLADSVNFHRFVQFVFDRQWNALKEYCNQRNVGLIGDVPIFVAHDSADVWAQRELFLLDDFGRAGAVSGYPPDSFNAAGQRWGHPHYNWPTHEATRFAWWIARFRRALSQFDAARIDHFLGFHRCWHVPGRARTARRGEWVCSPGEALFDALRRAIGSHANIIAEDLGKMTPEAAALRDRCKFPGMRVTQFGFGDGGAYHLPHAFVRRCVAYPGTHDNSTIVGWFDALRARARAEGRASPAARELAKARHYLNLRGTRGREVHWALIRSLMSSVADTVVFSVQDILGLDDRHRMNVPGTIEGNWRGRLRAGQLTPTIARRLCAMTHVYDRI